MDKKITCPLGHECEKATNEGIEVCAWYTKVPMVDIQNKKEKDEYGCAIAWMPILMINMSGQVQGTTSAIESMRNEQVSRQDQALQEVSEIIRLKNGPKVINAK